MKSKPRKDDIIGFEVCEKHLIDYTEICECNDCAVFPNTYWVRQIKTERKKAQQSLKDKIMSEICNLYFYSPADKQRVINFIKELK